MTLVLLCSCSSEQSIVQPVKMDNLQNSGCKFALSKTESRPEFLYRGNGQGYKAKS